MLAAPKWLLQPVVAPTPANKLLPFEKMFLDAAITVLQPSDAALLAKQAVWINNIQRLRDWKEITFSHKRWFRSRWPEHLLFTRRDRFRLAIISCTFGTKEALVDVWAADGHVDALASSTGLSGLSISGPLRIAKISTGA